MSQVSGNSKDNNPAFDYVADVLHPVFSESGMNSREGLANECMDAIFKEADGTMFFDKFHPKAARLLELLALRLMGEDWCQRWINENVGARD